MASSRLHPKDSASDHRIRQAFHQTWRLTLLVLLLPSLLVMIILVLNSFSTDGPDQSMTDDHAGHQVDLNHANAAELSLLPGIGETLGQRIVEERKKGLFLSLQDLEERVNGIGSRVSAKLKDHVLIRQHPVHGLEKKEHIEQNLGTEIANAEHEDED